MGKRLRDMEAADELRQKRDAEKNSLESFVFELRGQVRDNEDELAKVSPDDEREKIMEDLEALEEWLYEDGEDGGADAALSVYQDKRKEMSNRVKAIFTRLVELEKRPKAVTAARAVLKSSAEIMLLWPEERPQISDAETVEVKEVIESITTWLDEKEIEQKPKEDNETPVFTSREVSNKLQKLHSIVSRLLKKKRDAPEKPTKDKKDEEKEDKGEEEEATDDSDGSDDSGDSDDSDGSDGSDEKKEESSGEKEEEVQQDEEESETKEEEKTEGEEDKDEETKEGDEL